MSTAKPNRRVVTISANELEDVDVSRVSLVTRGANRIPFRILKSEDPSMGISLSTLFKQKREEELTPQIAAVVLAKNDNTESLLSQVKEQFGEPVELDEGQDDLIILKYQEFEEDTSTVVKMTDDIAAVIGNVEKGFHPFPGSSKFSENVKSMNFVPGLRLGMDALSETVFTIMSGSENKAQMKEDITSAVGEFSDFVVSMVSSIPTTAFKLEDLFAVKEDKDSGKKEEEVEGESVEALQEDKKKAEEATDEEVKEEEENDDEQSAQKQDEKDDDHLAEVINSAMSSIQAKMDASLSSLMSSMMKELDSRIEQVQKESEQEKDELTTRLTDAMARVEKAENAVKGTVVGGSHLSHESLGNLRQTSKANGEDVDRPGLFDDAFPLPGFDQ